MFYSPSALIGKHLFILETPILLFNNLFFHYSKKKSKMENVESLEKNLIALLKDAKAPAGMLKRTSASLATVGKTEMTLTRVLINGIPYPDWLVLKGRIKVNGIGSLQNLLGSDALRDIKLQPWGVGVPNPMELGVTIRLNLNGHSRV